MYYNYDTGLPAMFGTSSADAACNLLVSASTVYYSSSLALTNGTPLYYNECLTIPITASAYTTASQQYFKIGPYYVNFETNGYVVRDITVCTPSTTNIEWRVSGSAGGTLVIRDVNEVIKVNQNSANSSGFGFSGSFTLTNSETPYSVTASINAGSPTLRYRICNISTNSEYSYSGDITTANAPYSSSVNPTPVSSSVFLTVGSDNTPDACPIA
jgi:hypothetical protein